MKKPIAAKHGDWMEVWMWELPNNIVLQSDDESHSSIDIFFSYEEHPAGHMTKKMAQEVFQVILYPPGSEPSPESADPTDKYRMREEKERQYEIPRADILDNGDWN